ncbi:MAG: leucine-rich repeat domain-containing protein [Sediminimonas qiaohouensis]|uniref:Leucine-rich repeat domain-containing protein n=1 Tax=Sediminimonas qiaohouensis TaxID=552061 RepID=A0A7C9LLN0_9RHOB|nr:leucine-rich repeat domain-containing protein [Sediminimonas qiaohouensis]MTJ03540.1 leucine-rich repeat domain-containing protein [Sediminimonas qiaohouensis]
MSDADKAYKAAEHIVAEARQRAAEALDFTREFINLNHVEFRPLAHLPPEIGTLDNLEVLDLSQTQVADITPLQGLAKLKGLDLTRTQVADLRPIADLPKLGSGPSRGLSFANTPAARATPELTRLSEIEDSKDRTRETLAYLKALPPWPEPLPWEAATSSAADTEKPTPAPPEVRTAQSHIAFLLNHAAVSQTSAKTTAAQIRFALRDVPATHGNQLSPVLETMADVATVLERLAAGPLSPDTPDRERKLTARIAQLEAQIETLTGQLSDETLAREAAEELLKAAERHAGENGFWSNYKSAAGKTAGAGTAALVGIAAPTTLVYFLGADHPLIQAFLTVTGRLPK